MRWSLWGVFAAWRRYSHYGVQYLAQCLTSETQPISSPCSVSRLRNPNLFQALAMYGEDVNPEEMHKTAVAESKVVERLYFWIAIYFITGSVLDFGIPIYFMAWLLNPNLLHCLTSEPQSIHCFRLLKPNLFHHPASEPKSISLFYF